MGIDYCNLQAVVVSYTCPKGQKEGKAMEKREVLIVWEVNHWTAYDYATGKRIQTAETLHEMEEDLRKELDK